MATLLENWRQGRVRKSKAEVATPTPVVERKSALAPPVDISPNDPIIAYFMSAPGAVEIANLNLDSPGLRALKENGVQMVVPLLSQGELVGLLNLGPRLSQQEYSTDDRGLLNNLASQAAPAVRVAQLVREQQAEAAARERIEQELRVARLIQQTLLPKETPTMPGWQLATHYQPARAVGGDFYDFIHLDGGRLGIVIGDVTDKGVPAALVMATTRSILRSAALGGASPGVVLEKTNDLLDPDIPPKMFVTCLYAVLDPRTGRLRYANAGHDLPYRRHRDGSVDELRATGMPLGLMPGMIYEEKETILEPGDSLLLYSDGIVEAHNTKREMFSFPRLMSLVGEHPGGANLISFLLDRLAEFTGADWEQEDDVSMVVLQRVDTGGKGSISTATSVAPGISQDGEYRILAQWQLPSEPGNERQALDHVARVAQEVNLEPKRMEQLKTAVAEATMNAMEHGNKYDPDVPVLLRVKASNTALSVEITDKGGGQTIPEASEPDIEAKLAGLQSPRGWGLFLIKSLVDEMHVTTDEVHHTIELVMYLGGNKDGR